MTNFSFSNVKELLAKPIGGAVMAKSELDLNLDVDATPLMTLVHSEYDTYCPGGRSSSRCCDLL